MANLPGEATYTNNTSNAQIQISPFEYNLGAHRGPEGGGGGRRKKEGPAVRGVGGEGASYISTHTSVRYHLNANTFTGGDRGPFETARVPNVPEPLAIVGRFSAVAFPSVISRWVYIARANSCEQS